MALDALLEAAHRRELDVVVVTKLDRLARSVRHLCELADTFKAQGVDLVVLDQSIDTSTPMGLLTYHVLGAVAEFERALCCDRTKRALAVARSKGSRLGRPPALDARGRARVRRLHAAGRSVRSIASVVGVPRSVVHRALKVRPA